MKSFWQFLLGIIWRRRPPPAEPAPIEITISDFAAPKRDTVSKWIEDWAPLLVILLAAFAILAGLWWLY